MGITKEDADYSTAVVDSRLNNIGVSVFTSPDIANSEELIEEYKCLEAIRAIEQNAEKEFIETANDMVKGLEAYSTIDELEEKYDIQ